MDSSEDPPEEPKYQNGSELNKIVWVTGAVHGFLGILSIPFLVRMDIAFQLNGYKMLGLPIFTVVVGFIASGLQLAGSGCARKMVRNTCRVALQDSRQMTQTLHLVLYELTKRPPGACQLDKGAAPPYNPLLLACDQHLGFFKPTIATGACCLRQHCRTFESPNPNQWRSSNHPIVALGPTIREQNCRMAGHNLDN